MTVEGYLEAWLKLQTHLNEGRGPYQSIINTFCATLPKLGKEELYVLEPRHMQEFIDNQVQRLRPSTINGKLFMLYKAFEDAVRRGHMLSNIIYEEDFLDEDTLERKPFEPRQLIIMHERWTYLGDSLRNEDGLRALEWRRASKFGAYQGMRLGDSVNQIRANIDFGPKRGSGMISWKPEKTAHLDRVVHLPLHSEMEKELLAFKDSPPETKLTPLLAQTGKTDLCTEFKKELVAAGIDPEDHELKSRLCPAVSFRSHKRFYLNTMEKALVPKEILKLLGLHSSNATSRYLSPWTKKDAETWRQFIEKVKIKT